MPFVAKTSFGRIDITEYSSPRVDLADIDIRSRSAYTSLLPGDAT